MSFRASETSRGIFPSSLFYLVVVLSPTWWIPPLRFAAVGMTDVSGLAVADTNVPRFRSCGPGGGRLPPLQWGYHDWGDTVHPHRLYIQHGGRQIAAPTIHLFRITVYLTCLSPFCVSKNAENVVYYRRGGNLPPATWQKQPVRLKGKT